MKQHQPKLTSEVKLLQAIVAGMGRNIKAYYEISDANGQVVKGESKSLLKNFALIMQSFFNATNPVCKNTANGNVTLGTVTRNWGFTQGIVSSAGVCVSGTGVGAISSDNYGMGTLYQTTGAVTFSTDTDTSDAFQFSVYQSIVASSSTTINEVGFIAKMLQSASQTTSDILLIRDLVSPGFATTIGVAYTIKFTISFSTGADSYLTNLAQIWRGIMAGQNETIVNKQGGSSLLGIRTKSGSQSNGLIAAKSAITFGTGSTAPLMDDYALVAEVAESISVDESIITNDTTRYKWQNYQAVAFNNSYTLAEMALEMYLYDYTFVSKEVFAARCLISPTIAVVAGDGVLGKFIHDIAI